MNDQTARTPAESAAASHEHVTRALPTKRIPGGVASRPDLRAALRGLVEESRTPIVDATNGARLPSQQTNRTAPERS